MRTSGALEMALQHMAEMKGFNLPSPGEEKPIQRESRRRCCGSVFEQNSGLPARRACGHEGKIEEDGRWYCQLHVPSILKARQDEREAKRLEVWRKRSLDMAARSAGDELLRIMLSGDDHQRALEAYRAARKAIEQ